MFEQVHGYLYTNWKDATKTWGSNRKLSKWDYKCTVLIELYFWGISAFRIG